MGEGPLVLHRIASGIRMAKFAGQCVSCRLLENRFSVGCCSRPLLLPLLFLLLSYLPLILSRARRLSVRYTERNNTALIFEKLRSKFSARCSGFLLHNGKAEHEYYFALIVCIPVPPRELAQILDSYS